MNCEQSLARTVAQLLATLQSLITLFDHGADPAMTRFRDQRLEHELEEFLHWDRDGLYAILVLSPFLHARFDVNLESAQKGMNCHLVWILIKIALGFEFFLRRLDEIQLELLIGHGFRINLLQLAGLLAGLCSELLRDQDSNFLCKGLTTRSWGLKEGRQSLT